MSSQYRNSELAFEAPAQPYVNESFQRPAQLAYADYQNSYAARDSYSASLPPIEFESRPSHHHYPVHHHHYHHRRHGEVAVSHSHHVAHHEYHQVNHHRPYHHHNYRHAEHAGVNLSYSHHNRLEGSRPQVEHINWNPSPQALERSHSMQWMPGPTLENSSRFAGPPSTDIQALGDKIAGLAVRVAHRLGTVGDCAKGPRLVLDKLGLHLTPAYATKQGEEIRNSGLFDPVAPGDVRPGDYGVRNWSRSVVRANGVDKGDAFIVTGKSHGQILAANDHTFVVPADGGRYRNLQYYRPNAKFMELYGRNV